MKGDTEERDRFTSAVQAEGAEWKHMNDGFVEVSVSNGLGSESLFRAASAADVQIRHLTRRIPSLEEIFARAVGLDH